MVVSGRLWSSVKTAINFHKSFLNKDLQNFFNHRLTQIRTDFLISVARIQFLKNVMSYQPSAF